MLTRASFPCGKSSLSTWGFIGLGRMGGFSLTFSDCLQLCIIFCRVPISACFTNKLWLLAGYPMAKNLRAKIPEDDKLVIYDRNEDVTAQFVHENDHLDSNVASLRRGKNVEVARAARDVVERSVSPAFYLPLLKFVLHMMSTFYQ